MPHIVSDAGVAILDAREEDTYLVFQNVGDLFYLDVHGSFSDAKLGRSPIASYQLDTDDVLGALEKMSLTTGRN
jgi:hypothetical protein